MNFYSPPTILKNNPKNISEITINIIIYLPKIIKLLMVRIMKKLYLLLIILILLMVEVNLYNYNGFDFNSNKIEFEGAKFDLPDNFNITNESKNTISLYDKSNNITINITHLNDNVSIKTYFQKALKDNFTVGNETQKIDDINVYVTYRETNYTNSTQLFFEKDNTNYRMWILNYDNKNDYSSKIAAEIITSLRPANQGYIG